MRATFIGVGLCAATFMTLSTQGHALSNRVEAGTSPVQIEVRRAEEEDGLARAAKRPAPTTTGSGTIGSTVPPSNEPECRVITVRSPQANGTVIRKLRHCS